MKRECRSDAPRSTGAARARRASWPEGATAGVLLVATACIGLSLTLYQVAAPRDAFAEVVPGE